MGRTLRMIRYSKTASSGVAIKKTTAIFALIRNDAMIAVSIMTGALHAGRNPEETVFCTVVISLVRRVTSEETRNLSMFEKEKP